MSEPEQRQETHGSKFAEMFGFITPEDRSKWDQQRQSAKARDKQSAMKTYSKSSLGSMLEFGETNLKAKLSASHKVLAQRDFEEGHDAKIQRGKDGQLITETVSYEKNDDREVLGEEDSEFEMDR